jgi:hypothetical protein
MLTVPNIGGRYNGSGAVDYLFFASRNKSCGPVWFNVLIVRKPFYIKIS